MKTFFLAVLLLMASACSTTTDITRNPAPMTDFLVGQVYSLKKSAFILRGSLLTLREKEPVDSEGIIRPGALLVVRKVVVFRSPKVGTTTEVYAEILTGEHKGQAVSVSVISEILRTGYTKRDPEMLEPVERDMK